MHFTFRSSPGTGLFPGATWLLFFALLPSALAQKPSGPTSNAPAKQQTPPQRQTAVITTDSLKATVVSRAAHPADAASVQPVHAIHEDAPNSPEETARKEAEIVSLRKQIREKQKRIELLMRLFVTDERKFVQSPDDVPPDPSIQARVRYEQEELRAETAVCAQLRARLDALTASLPPH
jgi:hypothetical protein